MRNSPLQFSSEVSVLRSHLLRSLPKEIESQAKMVVRNQKRLRLKRSDLKNLKKGKIQVVFNRYDRNRYERWFAVECTQHSTITSVLKKVAQRPDVKAHAANTKIDRRLGYHLVIGGCYVDVLPNEWEFTFDGVDFKYLTSP